jgi:CDP-diglyceride synthetase
MKTRIIVAALCVPLLFIILFFLPPAVTAVLISGIAALASYQSLRAAVR